MGMFRLGDLDDWSPLDAGNVMAFDVPVDNAKVSIRVLAGAPINLFVTEPGASPQLVAHGSGNLRVRFTARGPFELSAEPQDAESSPVDVWVSGRRLPQVIPESDIPSFTTIEPRGVQPHDNVRRMMHIMELNNKRREDILRGELERMARLVATRAPAAPEAAPAAPEAAPAAPPAEPPAAT